jgi:hypothetical protein
MAQQHGWNGPSDPEIREMNAKYGIVTQGTKTMIVEKRIDPEEDSPFIWTSKEVLRDRYRSRKVLLPNGTGGKNEMPLADYWLGNGKADHYRRIDFNPETRTPTIFGPASPSRLLRAIGVDCRITSRTTSAAKTPN